MTSSLHQKAQNVHSLSNLSRPDGDPHHCHQNIAPCRLPPPNRPHTLLTCQDLLNRGGTVLLTITLTDLWTYFPASGCPFVENLGSKGTTFADFDGGMESIAGVPALAGKCLQPRSRDRSSMLDVSKDLRMTSVGSHRLRRRPWPAWFRDSNFLGRSDIQWGCQLARRLQSRVSSKHYTALSWDYLLNMLAAPFAGQLAGPAAKVTYASSPEVYIVHFKNFCWADTDTETRICLAEILEVNFVDSMTLFLHQNSH